MGAHVQTVISGSIGDANALRDELTSQYPTKHDYEYITSSASVNDATEQTLNSLSGIALKSDEIMDCWANLNFSGNTVSDIIEFILYWNNVAVRDILMAVPTGASGTSGFNQQAVIRWAIKDFTGTASLVLKAKRQSGTGQFVIRGRDLQYFITKRR